MIAVTAANGHLGQGVLAALLETHPPGEIVAVVRKPESVAEFAARGVVVRHGDYDDPASVAAALTGVESVLLISSHGPNAQRLRQHEQAVTACARAGVGRIVYTSFFKPVPENPFVFAEVHRRTEGFIREAGLPFTFLRDNFYADNLLHDLPEIRRTGALRWPSAKGRTAYVARDDVAAVAAAVLTGTGHEGQAYDMTGPEALDNAQVAALLGEALGRPVALEVISREAYRDALLRAGAPDWGVAGALSSFDATEQGFCEGVSDAVPRILGRPALSVREVLRRHAGRT